MGLLTLVLKLHLGRFLLDRPNARSLHEKPIPRIGGLAVVISCVVLLSAFRSGSLPFPALALSCLLIAAVSFWDDRVGLSVLTRLSVHAGAAIFVIWQAVDGGPVTASHARQVAGLALSGGGLALLLVGILWMTNLYNFMDGANGLAGGMTVIGFIAYAVAASLNGNHDLAFIGVVVSGAALGFLPFNFPKARVFLGDAGSVPLGFLAGALGLIGTLDRTWPWWFAPLVFSPFIVDATVTLIKRLYQRKKIWHAHREHYYQRLVLIGWTHTRLALTEYVLMLACAASALYALKYPAQQPLAFIAALTPTIVLFFWCAIYALLIIVLEVVLNRRERAQINQHLRA